MSSSSSSREVAHYVATAHPPGAVLQAIKCNFLAPESEDVVIAKSRRLEIRQLQSSDASETSEDPAVNSSSPFPVVFSVPINGRITSLEAFTIPSSPTSFLFLTTDQQQYAVISYDEKATPYPVETHASGSLEGDELFILGKLAECGPLVSVDPHHRCIVLHLYDGLLTIFPIQQSYQPPSKRQQQQKGTGMSTTFSSRSAILGAPFHARLEERTLLGITMLHHADPSATIPHVCVLHQDARGAQHITTHAIDLGRAQLVNLSSSSSNVASSGGGPPNNCERLKKSKVDGGSSLILSVPPPQPLVASAATAANSNAAPVHRPSGGVVILGQRQITYCAMNGYKVMPIPPALLLSWDVLPPDASGMPRFLLGDEFGNLHMLTLITQDGTVIALQLDTLGSCTLSSKLLYLDAGIVFCGSILGDSQLIQIHDEPIPVEQHDDMDDALELDDTTYLSVIEEYTNLGPIVDFDLVPTTPGGGSKGAESGGLGQSQVVTASGTSKSGSLRVIRNGIGMNEYASIELGGIQNMWSLRHDFDDAHHTYLVQSYVGQTRVLGVTSSSGEDDVQMEGADDEDDEEVGGTLEEAVLPGLESNESTLYVGNVVGNLYVQITEQKLRLSTPAGDVLDTWTHPEGSNITVGVGNESGQIAIALRGGIVVYFEIQDNKLIKCQEKQMDKEVSCMNINPFTPLPSSMQTDGNATNKSSVLAAGLWDDFTVRLLSLEDQLVELAQIHLSTKEEEEMEEASAANDQRRNRNNMMARSLCLITLDFAASHSLDGHSSRSNMNNSSPGVNMLFVGLGDGTLVSFAVVEPGDGRALTVQSKKEVSLGTQRINLVPLKTEKGGTCVLATGDRPTVIYLTGVGGTSTSNFNPKLCYSNVNLSAEEEEEGDISNDVSRPHSQQSIAVNVAASFFSPLLFDAMGSENYSLCVADDTNLRLGVIDDIQKLHVTTCRLGMAPRRIVHYAEGRMFAVGCIESGIKQAGMGGGEMNMGNCIRFLDDTTFDDVERIDLEPCEMVLSIQCVNLKVHDSSQSAADGAAIAAEMSGSDPEYKSYIIIGTAYALHDEDEPSKGRIIVMSSSPDGMSDAPSGSKTIGIVSELQVRGGVYSMCQFYQGKFLATINSKTQVCQLINEGSEGPKLSLLGVGHHGHILSLFVKSLASQLSPEVNGASDANDGVEEKEGDEKPKAEEEMLAIVGDLMRSISLVQYYPEHETLEEIARDFNANWTTAVEMLSNEIFIGAENWNNLYVLRRNTKAQSDEIRCRLDTVGEFHLGEMCNKFMSGSLVMPHSSSSSSNTPNERASRRRSLASPTKKSSDGGKTSQNPNSTGRNLRPMVVVGSQTLFGTVDGTLGSILGLDGPTAAFFTTLEKSMEKVVKPVGNFSHKQFRAFNADQRVHPSHGFVDGDLVESFLDLDRSTMQEVVQQMNRDGGWELDDPAFSAAGSNDRESAMAVEDDGRPELSVEDVVAVVEEMTMLH